jgi:putative endonuclease
MRDYYVYIMTNESGTLYTGVTNNLERRVSEHKQTLIHGFTKKYNITRIVYYETFPDIRSAIEREKQIKSWRRRKKLDLIVSMNLRWRDLADEWYAETDRPGVRPLASLGVTAGDRRG